MSNICFFLGGLSSDGGIGRVTSILVNEMCNQTDTNVFVYQYYNKEKSNFYVLNKKIKQSYYLDTHQSMKKTMISGGIRKLRKFIIENEIDIIIGCGALYFPLIILASKFTKAKCISWEHSNVNTVQDHKFQAIGRWFGAKFSDYVVVLTMFDYNTYRTKYKIRNIKQIYNPIDNELFENNSEYRLDSKKIMSVGRLTAPKNYEFLIEIAAEVFKQHKNWTWDIYGQGDLKSDIQNKIDQFGLSDKITLKGQVSNIYKLYEEYSFLVLTSSREGFPMVLLEAAANGLPLVSFDIKTGPSEIIEDGENGYLIHDYEKEAMSTKINDLINNKEKRLQMSFNSRKSCELFSLKNILIEWYELFDSLD